jgi:hypothetical protein
MITKSFPCKPISVFLGQNKLTSDRGELLWFWAHKQLAMTRFCEASIMFDKFDWVDWESVYAALWGAPPMFQIWACKQVMRIAPANLAGNVADMS